MNRLVPSAILLLLIALGNAQPPPPPDSPERMEAVRVQVALDRARFRPGKIDGLGGEFTRKALLRYNAARSEAWAERPPEGREIYRDYTITEADAAQVGPQASTPAAQEKLKSLPYAGLWEAVAERFHCDLDFLRELNPGADPKPGVTLRVPDVEPFDLAQVQEDARLLAEEKKAKASPTPGESPSPSPTASPTPPDLRLVLRRDERIIEVWEDGKNTASFPCTPGSEDTPVPAGTLKITSITPMPYFRWDKSVLESGVRSKNAYNLPPGPNNPVGIVWIALDRPSLGLHGTTSPDQIGRNQSHGCIRLANWDADILRKIVEKGTLVEVR